MNYKFIKYLIANAIWDHIGVINCYIFGILFILICLSSCKLEHAQGSNIDNKIQIININFNERSYIVKIPKLQPEIDSICITKYESECFDPCRINYIYIKIDDYDLLNYKNGCIFPQILPLFSFNDSRLDMRLILSDVVHNKFEFKVITAYYKPYTNICKTLYNDLPERNKLVKISMTIWTGGNSSYISGLFDLSSKKNEEEIFKFIDNLKKIEIIEVTN